MLKFIVPTIILATVPAVGLSAAAPRPAGDIAYLSMQRIFNETTEARAGAAKLEAFRQAKAKELSDKQKALDATHQRLVQLGGVFQASKRTQVKAEEDRQRADLKESTDRAQGELQTLQRQLQDELRRNLVAVVEALAKERSLRLVLNADTAVIWTVPGMDLTADVLARLNARSPKQSP
jgi:Skp family chaperone for outer membrane proteins